MRKRLLDVLKRFETDLEGVNNRFSGNEDLYIMCIHSFVKDKTMDELKNAIFLESWDDAFTAAHAIKGLAGNMGFVPLFHAAASLVVLIREGRVREIKDSYNELERIYLELASALCRYCDLDKLEETI